MIYEIALKKINNDNFSDYGTYIDESEIAPTYSDSAFDWWNAVGIFPIEGNISMGVVRPNFNPEFSEQVFEAHNLTPEVLVPIDDNVIVLVGKKRAFDNGMPAKEDFEAFLVPKGMAVSLNPGIWHHAPMTLSGSVKTLVLFKENTSFEDTIVKDLKEQGLVIKVKVD
ncbi:ureidoglycolate lyase [Neobacillus sp. NPDC093127]|uniref:ureidoglycolate lyase n=1 Tax=Neobacillus sp. NPDC093127 TaxID=3364296 RepID=UPI003806289E